MFGKLFAQTFSGSMIGAGPIVFAVWSYCISNSSRDGIIEINPAILALTIGKITPKEAQAALDFLASPDENSRNPAMGGRRLVREGEFQYRVVNKKEFNQIRTDEDRKAYNRRKQQESRERRRTQFQQKTKWNPPGSPSKEDVEGATGLSEAIDAAGWVCEHGVPKSDRCEQCEGRCDE